MAGWDVSLAPMAIAALERVLAWGVENIQATLSRLTRQVEQSVAGLGCTTLPADRRVGHIIGIRFPGGLPAGIGQALTDARVHVSVRGDALRVSPHLYNDEGDIARLVEVLRDLTAAVPSP